MLSPKRWRKRFLLPFSVTLLLCLAITSPWGVDLATQGLMANLPQDTGEPVQAIVVLGRGDELRQRRIEKVEKLWQQQRASRIFASGMLDAEFMLEQFEKNGIPKTALTGERCSQSTEENALFTSAVLYPQQVQKIVLITDTPHMMRSLLVFRASGFDVIPYPIPLPDHWSAIGKSQVLLREYLGLLKYYLENKFRQRTVEELRNPPDDVTRKLVEWNCKLPMVYR
ncbi:YdcF family protein [Floridanema evergladense]